MEGEPSAPCPLCCILWPARSPPLRRRVLPAEWRRSRGAKSGRRDVTERIA